MWPSVALVEEEALEGADRHDFLPALAPGNGDRLALRFHRYFRRRAANQKNKMAATRNFVNEPPTPAELEDVARIIENITLMHKPAKQSRYVSH